MQTFFSLLLLPVTIVLGLVRGILKLFKAIFSGLSMLIRRGPSRLIGSKSVFIEALFTFLGLISKADGRVSELDIAKTEVLFKRLRLNSDARASAKEFFKSGAQPDFDPTELGILFRSTYGETTAPRQVLVIFLIGFAQNRQSLEPEETAALYRVAEALNLSSAEVDRIIDSLSAGATFRGTASKKSAKEQLNAAYRIVGVSNKTSNRELKAAYRKLVSIHHPDKAIGRNLPEEAVAQANNRMQEIVDAFDYIKSARGLRN